MKKSVSIIHFTWGKVVAFQVGETKKVTKITGENYNSLLVYVFQKSFNELFSLAV